MFAKLDDAPANKPQIVGTDSVGFTRLLMEIG